MRKLFREIDWSRATYPYANVLPTKRVKCFYPTLLDRMVLWLEGKLVPKNLFKEEILGRQGNKTEWSAYLYESKLLGTLFITQNNYKK